MRAIDPLRRAAGFCVRTRRRVLLCALVLAALGWGAWTGARLARAHVALAAARTALERYDFPTARERLQTAARLRPGKPEIWLLGAQVARREGELTDAKILLARYEALAGETPEARLEAALQRVQHGEIERDVYYLMSLVDGDHPAAEQIMEALAVGADHIYSFDNVRFWLHHLLARFPKNPVGRLMRARMDDMLNNRDRAAAGCRAILDDFPENVKARLLLAGLLARAQQFAEAATEYEDVRRRRPNDLEPLLGLARCRDRTGHADAPALVRELEERFPNNGEAVLECGRFALKTDRPADAERLLRRAVDLAPNDPEVRYQLGLCLERLGKAEEARAQFERFKQIEADLKRLGELLEVVVKTPRDPAPRREAGIICMRNGQPAEGLRWLQGALEAAPADRATHDALATYYLGQGDTARANYHRQQAR